MKFYLEAELPSQSRDLPAIYFLKEPQNEKDGALQKYFAG
jgi:hypothetical protein